MVGIVVGTVRIVVVVVAAVVIERLMAFG